jgi:hypothetical protein
MHVNKRLTLIIIKMKAECWATRRHKADALRVPCRKYGIAPKGAKGTMGQLATGHQVSQPLEKSFL